METDALREALQSSWVSCINFGRHLDSFSQRWLLLFWLDCEFYRFCIVKAKNKHTFARTIYGKYVVPYIRSQFSEECSAEIELKIRGSVVDDATFNNAQAEASSRLLSIYKRWTFESQRGTSLHSSDYSGFPKVNRRDTGPFSSREHGKEPNECIEYLTKKMFNAQTGVKLQDRKRGLKTVSHTFLGAEAIDWIMRNVYFGSDRTKALELGKIIMQFGGGAFFQVGPSSKRPLFLLKDDDTMYRPLKTYQAEIIAISDDEFAAQLGISTDDEEGSERQVKAAPPAIVRAPSILSTSLSKTSASKSSGGADSRTVTVEVLVPKRSKKKLNKSMYRASSFTYGESSDMDVQKPSGMLVKTIIENDRFFLAITSELGLRKKELDMCARSIIYIFAESGVNTIPLIMELAKHEANETQDASVFFRSNGMVTYLMSAYAKLVGHQWLSTMLSPIISSLITDAPVMFDEDGEMDPASEGEFAVLMEEVIDRICASVATCPPHFRVLCHSFRKVIDSRFPEHSNLFLAGFMFLRYVCAALLSPDDFGIHPFTIAPDRQRILVAISKTLQSYCTLKPEPTRLGVVEGSSSEDSSDSHRLLSSLYHPHRAALNAFLFRLTSVRHLGPIAAFAVEHSKDLLQRSLRNLHQALQSKADQLLIFAKEYGDSSKQTKMRHLLEELAKEYPNVELKRASSAVKFPKARKTKVRRSSNGSSSNVLKL